MDYSKLSDSELNAACAKLAGWVFIPNCNVSSWRDNWIRSDVSQFDMPDYLADDRLCGELLDEVNAVRSDYVITVHNDSTVWCCRIEQWNYGVVIREFTGAALSRRRAVVEAYCMWKEARNG